MNVAGIIAEYNPFHNGHAYHIQKVREETDASYIIALMSGDFVQRGAPACADKYVRAQMALACGADLVLELPVCAAVSSAETFARTGVSLLAHSGVVTHLGFGCESDAPAQLLALCTLFADEPAAYQELLGKELKKGKSFPAARAAAAKTYLDDPAITSVLESPNNILAIEYLKAIQQLQTSLTPCMIRRQGGSYHDRTLDASYSSATAIRELLTNPVQNICSPDLSVQNSNTVSSNRCHSTSQQPAFDPTSRIFAQVCDSLNGQIPEAACTPFFAWLEQYGSIAPDDFSALLHYKLLLDFSFPSDNPQNPSMRTELYPPTAKPNPSNTLSGMNMPDLQSIASSRKDLDNRTRKLLEQYTSFSQFTELLKTRDRTYTAVSRYLLSHLLNISEQHTQALQETAYAPYLRILGLRKKASPLLKALHEHSRIPVLTRLASEEKDLNPHQQLLLHADIQAAHIYNSVLTAKTGRCPKNEYRHPLIYY